MKCGKESEKKSMRVLINDGKPAIVQSASHDRGRGSIRGALWEAQL